LLNATSLLREDHRRVKELLSQLESTTERGTKRREDLVGRIEMELKIHSKLEEEIFYPAYKNAASKKEDKELFYEATEEHHVVDMVLPELKASDPASNEFGAKAKVLKELIEHHVEEEETEMFKKAARLMNTTELQDLADAMVVRKKTLVAQWENPLTAPFKKVQSAAEKFIGTSVKNAKASVIGKGMKAMKGSKSSGGSKSSRGSKSSVRSKSGSSKSTSSKRGR